SSSTRLSTGNSPGLATWFRGIETNLGDGHSTSATLQDAAIAGGRLLRQLAFPADSDGTRTSGGLPEYPMIRPVVSLSRRASPPYVSPNPRSDRSQKQASGGNRGT